MSLTIATFHADDIITDPAAVIDAINHACHQREIPKRVQAVCGVGESIYFILRHQTGTARGGPYHLVPLQDLTSDGFVATINAHEQGSLDIVGVFSARETTYAVFREDGCRA